jgi:hypothetical protein
VVARTWPLPSRIRKGHPPRMRLTRGRGKPFADPAGPGSQWTVTSPDDLILLEGGGRNVVHRRGETVIREGHGLARPLRSLDDPQPPHPRNSAQPRSPVNRRDITIARK